MKIIKPYSFKDCTRASRMINKYNHLINLVDEKQVAIDHYVIKDKNKIVATIGFKLLSWHSVEICHMCVHPKYRNKRLATRLISYLLDKRLAPLYVCTIYRDNNYRDNKSLNLFLKFGFRIGANVKKEYYLIREN